MDLDEILQELGVNMEAVGGLRRLEEFDDSLLQSFVDRGLGKHIKQIVDLSESIYHASDYPEHKENTFVVYYHPNTLLRSALEVTEMLAGNKREDVLPIWSYLMRKFSGSQRNIDEYRIFMLKSPAIVRQLLDDNRIDDLEGFALKSAPFTESVYVSSFGFKLWMYEHALPMYGALAERELEWLYPRWLAVMGSMSSAYEYGSYHPMKRDDFVHIVAESPNTVRTFIDNGLQDIFSRFYSALFPGEYYYSDILETSTAIFGNGSRILESFLEADALEQFDYALSRIENPPRREAGATHEMVGEWYQAAFLFGRSGEVIQRLAEKGSTDKFKEWFDRSASRELELRRGKYASQKADIHYEQAILHDIPFDTIERHICSVSNLEPEDYPNGVAKFLKSDVEPREKSRILTFYGDFLSRGRMSSADEKFFDYMRLNPGSTLPDLTEQRHWKTGNAVRHAIPVINEGRAGFADLEECVALFDKNGIIMTKYLIQELITAGNKKKTISKWKSRISSFESGNFDPDNELHRNLEYTRFRKLVDDEKVKRHIKNHFSFRDYLKIFERQQAEGEPFTDQDRFEIDCVAYEAIKLRDFILAAGRQAAEQGRATLVVPNLSYGYLPASPLVEELKEEGIDFLIGAKVGSTECHGDKDVVNSRLLKGKRTKVMNEQPLIIVVDGTEHLISRDDEHKTARYPDSHQGYLNQVIAMNDAQGYINMDYSRYGKTQADIDRLRQTPEFQRSVRVYKDVLKSDILEPFRRLFKCGKSPYSFEFWNAAGENLIARSKRKKVAEFEPVDPADIKEPAMVFCNVGVLDKQIPPEVRQAHPGSKHKPAYFDDSHKILAFDFGYDKHGVRYLNRLETEVKKSYKRMTQSPDTDHNYFMPEMLRYVSRHGGMPTVCGQS